jgi:hypothetical protein
MMKGNPIAIFDVAQKYIRTVEFCVDRLHTLNANHELRLLTARLTRLSFRATPPDQDDLTSDRERVGG